MSSFQCATLCGAYLMTARWFAVKQKSKQAEGSDRTSFDIVDLIA